ncbi:helix-turn-helix domain-containing protein [Veillonella sp. CHU732]|uniref:helix-turn-helix domain-containing protein n=1 Tax=Veillonella sp. CHU732 TaxID=2490949 RepID=UPI000F8F37FF|nr:helix-turn-helix domain-containing protein [Veillonella sp. CHU732]
MSKIVATFSERLKESLKLKNIKAIELAQLSGISRGAISSYLSGRWKAKQDNIYLLAKALNVNEAWLMGYDVPMESVRPQNNYSTSSPSPGYIGEPNPIEQKTITYTPQQQTLLAETASFTDEQYDKLFDYINFLKLSKSS